LTQTRRRIGGNIDQFSLGHFWLFFVVVLVVGLRKILEDGVDAGHSELDGLVVHHIVRVGHGGRSGGGGGDGREEERISCGWMQFGVVVVFFTSAKDMSAVSQKYRAEMVERTQTGLFASDAS
jgi:hypothetical protein